MLFSAFFADRSGIEQLERRGKSNRQLMVLGLSPLTFPLV
jgi:hypothetical protein